MLASEEPSILTRLTEGLRRSKNYEWMQAAELYTRAFEESQGQNPTERAKITEKIASCYLKASFQSKARKEFKERIALARTFAERTANFYEELEAQGLVRKSRAALEYANFWIEDNPLQREHIISRCVQLAKEAAGMFKEKGNTARLTETYAELLTYLSHSIPFVKEWRARKEIFENAVETGKNAIDNLEKLEGYESPAECISTLMNLLVSEGAIVLEPKEVREMEIMREDLKTRILDISGKTASPYPLCLAKEVEGTSLAARGEHFRALQSYQDALPLAATTRDSLLTGRLSTYALENAVWAARLERDEEKSRKLIAIAQNLASQAIENLGVSLEGSLLHWAYGWYAESYSLAGTTLETDRDKKKELLRKAIDIATTGMDYRDHSRLTLLHHALSKALYFLAVLTEDGNAKTDLLLRALPVREETVRMAELLTPHAWGLGVMYNYSALVKADLSSLETEPASKARLLNDAITDMEKCVTQCRNWATNPAYMRLIASYYEWYGDIEFQLYNIEHHESNGIGAISSYQEAITFLVNLDQVGSLGGLRWKLAKVYDSLGKYKEASEEFSKSAEDYRFAVTKLPSVASLFQDLAYYMDSWSLIEQARLLHGEEQYSGAAEKYGRVAGTLKTNRTWGHLSRHYLGCSSLEEGEALSREEKHDLSLERFGNVAQHFLKARAELENKLEHAEPWDQDELHEWVKVTEGRGAYCLARADIEEARLLEKKGETRQSLEKYRSASEALRALGSMLDNSQARSEIGTLRLFCEAWAKMGEADAKASPEQYAEAADLFEKAKDSTTLEKTRLLAFANARICRALETGTRFRLTRNAESYSEIKALLETAQDYYDEAGFGNASKWTRGTQRLFDALLYLSRAETEIEPVKKTDFYRLAENQLENASTLYADAGFLTKAEETTQHLKRTREKRELLLTPVEALEHNPASSGASTGAVTLARDQALGQEKFEAANIVGTIFLPHAEIGVGKDFTVELEMVNAGKSPATLIKLQNISPEGLQPRDDVLFQESSIDMKGKRLEYLKTHDVKIDLKATREGRFQLEPRVLYVDEKGNYRSFEFSTAALMIGRPHVESIPREPKSLRTEVVSSPLLEFLARAFIEDYMEKRLSYEQAGWRSLVEVSNQLDLPRSQVYGDARHGHTFGKPIEALVKAEILEYRRFLGQRGRGGNIIKVRVRYEKESVGRIVDDLALKPFRRLKASTSPAYS